MRIFLTTIAVILAITALSIGGWKLYWYTHRSAVNQEYSINREGQPMQSAQIAHARDLVMGYHNSTDPAQQRAISQQFCALVQDVTAVPSDLVTARLEIC